MENFTKIVRSRIAQFLNNATAAVVHSYERYLGSDLPNKTNDPVKEPKEFKEFHDAGKSAASHLETLLKLANATDESEEREKSVDEKEQQRVLQERLKVARKEIDLHDS